MIPARRPRWVRLGVVLTVVPVVAVVLAVAMIRHDQPPADQATTGAGTGGPTAVGGALTAAEAGRAFLAAYVDPDGRVVRHDEGGDTVSEGQAYAMLIAVGVGDDATFNRVWGWTQAHLLRPDGTLSWHWQDGRVVDPSSASDADLDAARALVLAGRAFGNPRLTAAGTTLGTAVLDVETVTTQLGRILVAGSWATTEPYAYNPSYPSPVAIDLLADASADGRWAELRAGTRAISRQVLAQADLPPDWAQAYADGRVEFTAGAAGRGNDGVRYGYDATRLPLRYAESCHAEDVALAAQLAEPLARFGGDPATRDLGGRPLGQERSVVAIAAQSAVDAAAGHRESAVGRLLEADQLQQQTPTYYGGAWDALARLLLTERSLGGCPPLTG